jgi:hypothetical protein
MARDIDALLHDRGVIAALTLAHVRLIGFHFHLAQADHGPKPAYHLQEPQKHEHANNNVGNALDKCVNRQNLNDV